MSAMFLALATRRRTVSQVQHRCDKLESLEYMLLYFLQIQNLWQGLKAANQEQKKAPILRKKEEISIRDLGPLPREFDAYFEHVFSCSFGEKPDIPICADSSAISSSAKVAIMVAILVGRSLKSKMVSQ